MVNRKLTEGKTSVQERRDELIELIKEKGLWRINRMDFAKKHGVSNVQIHKDIQVILPHIKLTDIKEIEMNIDAGLRKSMIVAADVLETTRIPNLKLDAARTFVTIAEKATTILESYGRKQKVPEKIDMDFTIQEMRDRLKKFHDK